MLAPGARLRRRNEFAATVRGGRRAAAGVVVVHLAVPLTSRVTAPAAVTLPAGPQPPAGAGAPVKAGFVVPKTVGGAVVRNKVRRRLRHLVRDRLGALPPGSTVVVRALPGAADRDFTGLAADLDKAMAGAQGARVSGAGRSPRTRRRTR